LSEVDRNEERKREQVAKGLDAADVHDSRRPIRAQNARG